MSVRVDKAEDDVWSILGRSQRLSGWRWWSGRRSRQELAAREATRLLSEFGKDAYWLACICMRRSGGALRRHWQAVATEIEQRTGRASAATSASGKTAGSPHAPHHQYFAPLGAKRDASRRGADDLRDERPQPDGRYRRPSQIAYENEFDQRHEGPARNAGAARAERDHRDNPGRSAAMGPYAAMGSYDEEMPSDAPRKRRRLVRALALIGCATVGTAAAYAYWSSHPGPSSTQTSAAPPQGKPAQPSARGAPPGAAANAAAGGYVVQVSSGRSRADAQASFRSLQAKFPSQLGGRTAIVRRTDLGAKGIYYRAVVGPFASASAADQFCGSLKTAGGQCIIQRN